MKTNPSSPWHWFQYLAAGIIFTFFVLMIYVSYISFSRHSGVTKLDMAKIQKMRYEAEQTLKN